MNILDTIIAQKYKEVELAKERNPLGKLELTVHFDSEVYSITEFIKDPARSGIIAEFKRRSPSKGLINGTALPNQVANAYDNAGVSGMSVLTDLEFFGGSLDDLKAARDNCAIPILRKEFIVDEYQILEAKAVGADLILLIAAALEPKKLKRFASFAKSLGLEVLMEVHSLAELEACICPDLNLIGVNNRNLKTFEVSIDTSKELAKHIPDDFVKISESGISNIDNIKALRPYGYEGFLIGENFMKTDDPGKACQTFIEGLS